MAKASTTTLDMADGKDGVHGEGGNRKVGNQYSERANGFGCGHEKVAMQLLEVREQSLPDPS